MNQELLLVIRVQNMATAQLQALRGELAALGPQAQAAMVQASSAMMGFNASITSINANSALFLARLGKAGIQMGFVEKGAKGAAAGITTMGASAKAATVSFKSLWLIVKTLLPFLMLVKAVMFVKDAFIGGYNAAVEFGESLNNLWTLTDLTASGIMLLGNSVRELALQFNVTGKEALDAMYQIYSATFTGADAFIVLEGSIKGAVAGLAEVFDVADMLTTVLNAFGMEAQNVGYISDLLFTTIKFGKTTMSELAHQFGRLAGVAAPAGAKISDLTAAIATLTRQGIATDWAVTSIRQTFMQLLNPSGDLAKAIKALGYETGRAMIESIGFAEAIKDLAYASEVLGIPMENMFSNVRAITAVLPLATTAAREYAKDIARMAASGGAMGEAFGKQIQAAAYQIDQMKSAWTSFGSALFEGWADTWASFSSRVITPVLQWITRILGDSKELIAAAEAATFNEVVFGEGETETKIREWLMQGNVLPQELSGANLSGGFGGFGDVATGELRRISNEIGITAQELIDAVYKTDTMWRQILIPGMGEVDGAIIFAANAYEKFGMNANQASMAVQAAFGSELLRQIDALTDSQDAYYRSLHAGEVATGKTQQTYESWLSLQLGQDIDRLQVTKDLVAAGELRSESLRLEYKAMQDSTSEARQLAYTIFTMFGTDDAATGGAMTSIKAMMESLGDTDLAFQFLSDVMSLLDIEMQDGLLKTLQITRDQFNDWAISLGLAIDDLVKPDPTIVRTAGGQLSAINVVSPLDTIINQIVDVFNEFPNDFQQVTDYAVALGKEAQTTADSLKGLMATGKLTDVEMKAMAATVVILERNADGLTTTFEVADDAAKDFAARLDAIDLSGLTSGIDTLLSDVQIAIGEASTLGEILGAVGDMGSIAGLSGSRESIERIMNGPIWGTMAEEVKSAILSAYGQLPEEGSILGMTNREIAAEADKAARAAESAANKAASAAKAAAREAQAAADAAFAAAQDSFRQQFEAPKLGAISDGDWMGAADQIKSLMSQLESKITEGAGLDINAAEVLSIISGMKGDLMSSLNEMVGLGRVSQEFADQIEEYLTPKLIYSMEQLRKGVDGLDLESSAKKARDLMSAQEQLIEDLKFFGFATEDAEIELLKLREAADGLTESMRTWNERWTGFSQQVTDLILGRLTDVLHGFFENIFGLGEQVKEITNSLNIPSGFKTLRAAWGAATPGQPWQGDGSETGDDGAKTFWSELLRILAASLIEWTIRDIVEKLVGWVIKDIISPLVEWAIDEIVTPILTWVIREIVEPIWTWFIKEIVEPITTWFVKEIVEPITSWFIKEIVEPLVAGVSWFITDIVTPVADWMWQNVIKGPAVWIWENAIKGPAQWIWNNVIKSPNWNSILGNVGKVAIVASSIVMGITAGRDFGTWLGDILGVNEEMAGFLENISGVFGGALMGAMMGYFLGGIPGAWIGLTAGGIAGAISGLIEGRYADGGMVSGTAGSPQLAIVHGGEQVLTPSQQQSYGGGGTMVTGNTFVLPNVTDPESFKKEFNSMTWKANRRENGNRFGMAAATGTA